MKQQNTRNLLLVAFLFGMLTDIQAQPERRNTSSAMVTATVITDMAGINQFEDMNFGNSQCEGTASLTLVSNHFAYAVTFPGDTFTVTSNSSVKEGEEKLVIRGIVKRDEAMQSQANTSFAITVNYN